MDPVQRRWDTDAVVFFFLRGNRICHNLCQLCFFFMCHETTRKYHWQPAYSARKETSWNDFQVKEEADFFCNVHRNTTWSMDRKTFAQVPPRAMESTNTWVYKRFFNDSKWFWAVGSGHFDSFLQEVTTPTQSWTPGSHGRFCRFSGTWTYLGAESSGSCKDWGKPRTRWSWDTLRKKKAKHNMASWETPNEWRLFMGQRYFIFFSRLPCLIAVGYQHHPITDQWMD